MLELDELQERIEDRIASDGGWVRSAHTYDEFPPSKDSGDILHRSFAVGLPDTTATSEERQPRGRRTPGSFVLTTVAVRFAMDVRADDKRGSYREALQAEAELRSLVMATDRDDGLQLRYEGTPMRTMDSESTRLIEVRFLVHHHVSLA